MMMNLFNSAFFRQENRVLWLNPSTPVFLSFAWMFAALLAFYAGGFFMGNEASPHALLGFLPWVYALMLPALAMNTWAEDWRRGAAERYLTLPFGLGTLVFSRFMALWGLNLIFLLGTWPFVATLYWLGSPDLGPIVSGYLGALLLGGVLMAASLLASALSRSYVVAFVGGMLLCLLLVMSGWGIALSWIAGYLPQQVVGIIRDVSLMEHYRTFIIGQINLRSVLFFAVLITGFNIITWAVLLKRAARVRKVPPAAVVAGTLAAMVAMALVAPLVPWRLDMTSDRLYTLSPQTVEILRNSGTLKMTVFYSDSNPDLPPAVRRQHRQLMDTLGDFKRAAPETFTYEVKNTDMSVSAEVEAADVGMKSRSLPNGEVFYHGILLEGDGRRVIAPFLEIERTPYIEFDLASLLAESRKTSRKNLTVLAIPELVAKINRPEFLRELGGFYNIVFMQPGQPEVPQDTDALIIMPAAYYPEESLYAVSQYLMKGGRALMFVDPYYRTVPEGVPNLPDRNADDFANDHMADLLRAYGIGYEGEAIVGDMMLAAPVSEEAVGYTTYPFWLALAPQNVNMELPFTSFVSDVLLAEAGSLSHLAPLSGLKTEDIFVTTDQAQLAPRAMFDSMAGQLIGPQLKTEKKKEVLGVLITGNFPPALPEMPASVRQFYTDYAAQGAEAQIPAMLRQATHEGALIALTDIDFTHTRYAFRNVPGPDGKPIPQSANDNLVFLFNTLQWLTGEGDLLGLRGKGVDPRTFTRIEALLQKKAVATQKAEQQMAAELYEVTLRMKQLQGRNIDSNLLDALADKEERAYFSREYRIKADLRQLRRKLRDDINQIGTLLALGNAFLMPVLLLVGYGVYRLRRRKGK